MLIRLRTEARVHKLELAPGATVLNLRQKVLEKLVEEEGVKEWATFQIATTQDGSGELADDQNTLEEAGLGHGSMVFVYGLHSESTSSVQAPAPSAPAPAVVNARSTGTEVRATVCSLPRPHRHPAKRRARPDDAPLPPPLQLQNVEPVRAPIPVRRERLLPPNPPPRRANYAANNAPPPQNNIGNYWPFNMFNMNANQGGQRLGGADAAAPARGGIFGGGRQGGYGAIPQQDNMHGLLNPSQGLVSIFFSGMTVRIIAIFDGLQLFFNVLEPSPLQPLFVALVWGPFVGYYAGARYRRKLAGAYAFYWLARINIFAFFMVTGVYPFLQLISICFSAFMLWYVIKFWQSLGRLSDADVDLLATRPAREWLQDGNQGAMY
mmetsp:Transcript_3339/g.9734  ORF Transcript_3339/g.9734 Transcript_3339/m.9734 type:complete len:379 (-) Transcript_3339:369-1505(-)